MTGIESVESVESVETTEQHTLDSNEFVPDGTACKVRVMHSTSREFGCGKPGMDNYCEFHSILTQDARRRSACRVSGIKPDLVPGYEDVYISLMVKLIAALKRDKDRAKSREKEREIQAGIKSR